MLGLVLLWLELKNGDNKLNKIAKIKNIKMRIEQIKRGVI